MWEKTETQKNVIRILLKFRSMLAGFLAVVVHSWDLDQKRYGTRPVLTNQMEIGTELQKWRWYSNELQNLVTQYFVCLSKREFKKQWTWQKVYTIQRHWRKHRDASPHSDFCKSAQYLRSLGRFVQRIERKFIGRFSWRYHPKIQNAQEHFMHKKY